MVTLQEVGYHYDGSGNGYYWSDRYKAGTKCTAGYSGKVTKISARLYNTDTVSHDAQCAIYDEDENLLVVSDKVTLPANQSSLSWVDFTVSSDAWLESGHDYFIIGTSDVVNPATYVKNVKKITGATGMYYYLHSNSPYTDFIANGFPTKLPSKDTLTSEDAICIYATIDTDNVCYIRSLSSSTLTLDEAFNNHIYVVTFDTTVGLSSHLPTLTLNVVTFDTTVGLSSHLPTRPPYIVILYAGEVNPNDVKLRPFIQPYWDTFTWELTKLRSIVGDLTVSSSLSRFNSLIRTFISDSNLSSLLSRLFMPNRTMDESTTLNDAFDWIYISWRQFDTAIGLSSSLTRFVSNIRAFTSDSTLSSSISRFNSVIRNFVSNSTLSSSLVKIKLTELILQFTSSLSSTMSKMSIHFKSITANSTLSSSLTRMFKAIRTFSSSSTMSSSITQLHTAIKSLTATLTASSTLNRFALNMRSLTANSTLSSSLTRVFIRVKAFVANLTISSSWAKTYRAMVNKIKIILGLYHPIQIKAEPFTPIHIVQAEFTPIKIRGEPID